MVNKWSKFAQSLSFPRYCALCGNTSDNQLPLCSGCQLDLPWLKQCCRSCALPIETPNVINAICGRCLKNPPAFDQSLCLFHYSYPIDRLITGLKFKARLSYGKLLGQLLAQSVQHQYRPEELPQLIIPVPLHRSRLRERGFNQAHEIARSCARELGLPLNWRICQRIQATPHQIGLDAATRRRNLRNAFATDKQPEIPSIALIDDVMTTGSTLQELAKTFRKAGVATIHTWCVARTVTNY